ncbi:MAG TPA: hypothetical protein VFZ22_09030 [Pyrinomonadaceae bacterium]|nr:hypothetical protein [Pyrinomonadaceae bacterium]
MGEAWVGVVESVNETTREITLSHPDQSKTEKFVCVLEEGYQVKLKDGTSRELKVSELKPGLRVRIFYKSKTAAVAGRSEKIKVVKRIDFLGRDNFTRMREMLRVEPSIAVTEAKSRELPKTDPFKLHLALEPENMDKGLLKWVERWNKESSAKYGRVEIVNDVAQADASLVAIWGQDDSFMSMVGLMTDGDVRDLRSIGFGTGYLIIKDDKGLHVLWQSSFTIDAEEPQRSGPFLGQVIEGRLKARTK